MPKVTQLSFRFKLIPFIAMLAVVVAGVALGNWQQRRAEEKTKLGERLAAGAAAAPLVLNDAVAGGPQASGAANAANAAISARDVAFRRVQVRGEFVRGWPLYLDNRPYQGRAGFYVLMPFKIAGSDMHVLVARGWLPRDPLVRDKLPFYMTPTGPVTLHGLVRQDAGHVLQLGAAPVLRPGAIVQNADPAQVAAASGLALEPFVIEQSGALQAGDDVHMVRDWPAPELGVDKHRGYAFQWYALAATAFIFFVWNGFRRGKQ